MYKLCAGTRAAGAAGEHWPEPWGEHHGEDLSRGGGEAGAHLRQADRQAIQALPTGLYFII